MRVIESVRRLRDVFILEKGCCLIKGLCCKGENAEVPIHIKDSVDALPRPLKLDIQKRLKNDIIYLFLMRSMLGLGAEKGYRDLTVIDASDFSYYL